MKKMIIALISVFIVLTVSITAFATEIQPYGANYNAANTSFTISTSGLATVTNTYRGVNGVTTNAEITTKVQRKVGLIWVTVDDGKWTDTSTATNFSKSHSVQLTKTGTYRTKVEFVISGSGGADDEISRIVEKTYS